MLTAVNSNDTLQNNKVALVDIDGTLVTGQNFNDALINRLKEEGYKEIWLFTQRNKFLQAGKLGRLDSIVIRTEAVVERLKQVGLNVKVSTSLDQFYESGMPGEYYEKELKEFEEKCLKEKAKFQEAEDAFDRLKGETINLSEEDFKVLCQGMNFPEKSHTGNTEVIYIDDEDFKLMVSKYLELHPECATKKYGSINVEGQPNGSVGVPILFKVKSKGYEEAAEKIAQLRADAQNNQIAQSVHTEAEMIFSANSNSKMPQDMRTEDVYSRKTPYHEKLNSKIEHYQHFAQHWKENNPDKEVEFHLYDDRSENLSEIQEKLAIEKSQENNQYFLVEFSGNFNSCTKFDFKKPEIHNSEKIGMSADSTSSSHSVKQKSLNISSAKQENQDNISSWKCVALGAGGGAAITAGLATLGIVYLGFSIATLGIGAVIGAVIGGVILGSMALISKYSPGPPLEKSKESENDVHKLGAEECAKKYGYERVPFWENWSGWKESSSDKSPNPTLGV